MHDTIEDVMLHILDPVGLRGRGPPFTTDLTVAEVAGLCTRQLTAQLGLHYLRCSELLEADTLTVTGVAARGERGVQLLTMNLASYVAMCHDAGLDNRHFELHDATLSSGPSTAPTPAGKELLFTDSLSGAFLIMKVFPHGDAVIYTVDTPRGPLSTLVDLCYPDEPAQREQLAHVPLEAIHAQLQEIAGCSR